jgi:hypothetical protein
MMKKKIQPTIPKVSQGIASILLMSQLLTSCGGAAEALRREPAVVAEASLAGSSAPLLASSSSAALPEPALPADTEKQEANTTIEVRYLNLAGVEHSIQVDVAHTNVAEFLERIKQQERLVDAGCRFVARGEAYNEADTRLLGAIVDRRTIEEEALTIIKVSNVTIAQALLGANYLGEEAWQKLDITVSAQDLPAVSDELIRRIKAMQTQGEQPLLVLDLGKSIEELEALCYTKDITILSTEYEWGNNLRAEACYKSVGTCCTRWLLLPGSDHGVLPGSRDKTYNDQVQHMQVNYPGYEMGGVRELVTLWILKDTQDETVLFPREPMTYGRCKDQYQNQTYYWQGHRIALGGTSSASGGLVPSTVAIVPCSIKMGFFAFWSLHFQNT